MIVHNNIIQPDKDPRPKIHAPIKGFSKEQKLFLQLLHNYPDGAISIIDVNYNFIITGGELHQRLAADPSDLIGNDIYPNFPEEIRNVIKQQLKNVFAGNNISTFELPHLVKGEFYVMDAFPLKEKDGSITHAGVIIRNISHLKMAEKELKVSLEKEKELSEMKSRFITMASHEFRTPLSTMLLSVQLLKKYQTHDAQDKVNKHLARIESSIQVLNDILNDFLTVGKIQEGKYLCSPVTFNIKEHIISIIKEFDNNGKEGQQISYTHIGNEMVFLDPFLSQHILRNLVSNAIKFTTKKATVEVNTQWIDDRLVLSVKDHGIGIPTEYRKHLFEQFYRASNATNIQGTGLGLFTVNKYVELMNGTIRYTSKLDKGTRFVVTF